MVFGPHDDSTWSNVMYLGTDVNLYDVKIYWIINEYVSTYAMPHWVQLSCRVSLWGCKNVVLFLLWSCWWSFERFNTCLWCILRSVVWALALGFLSYVWVGRQLHGHPHIPLWALLSQAVKRDPKTFRFAAECLKDDKGFRSFPSLGVTDWKQNREWWLYII